MSNPYRAFFIDNPTGQELLNSFNEIISTQHTKAENDPDHARDYTQRAKGVREAISLIHSLSAEDSQATKEAAA
jgi:hypothetical protein